MPEFEPHPNVTISLVTLDDVAGYRAVQARGWMDTYPNEERGVPEAQVKETVESWMTPQALLDSKERVKKMLEDSEHNFLYVAKDGDKVVGMGCSTKNEDNQRLEALYVDKEYRSTGVAQALTDQILSHLDLTKPIKLETVAYNDRAIHFYEKYGFETAPDSEHMYKNMPSIRMIRAGDSHEV